VGLSIKGGNVAGRQGGGREIINDNESYLPESFGALSVSV
jgi:hypothetical protein